jgi:hypothetical protein
LAFGAHLDPQTSPVGGRSPHPLRCLEAGTMAVGEMGSRRIIRTCERHPPPESIQHSATYHP